MTRARTNSRKKPKLTCGEILADPRTHCPAAEECAAVYCLESQADARHRMLRLTDAQGPGIWTTADITGATVLDEDIKELFTLLSIRPGDVSRVVVSDPSRLAVLAELGKPNIRTHVGIDTFSRFGIDDAPRVEALKKAPAAVKFIRFQDIDRDLCGIDLYGIDYVTDGVDYFRVKDGAVQRD